MSQKFWKSKSDNIAQAAKLLMINKKYKYCMKCEFCQVVGIEIFCLSQHHREVFKIKEMNYCQKWGDIKKDYER